MATLGYPERLGNLVWGPACLRITGYGLAALSSGLGRCFS